MIRALGRLGWTFHRSGRHQYVLTDGKDAFFEVY
jgi:hypothetical protein